MLQDVLHLKAPGNWINDPNGFIYYKGEYHLFYQHFPYAPVWGTMHWGHAVSRDLVHWEHLGVVLFPTKSYDRNGIFSGSAIEKDGQLYLYYSAVVYDEPDQDNIHVAVDDAYVTSQAMMISEDGYQFDNWGGKRQIIPVSTDEETAHASHTRDPKVWEHNGQYYMILGSTVAEKTARVVFYKSQDGIHWEYANQYRDKTKAYGTILECPDLFKVDDTYVFTGSPMNIGDRAAGTGEAGYAHHAVCAIAQFTEGRCELELPEQYQFVDYGMDLYAPQTTVDAQGRRIMIAWMRMPKPVEDSVGKRGSWNGMMCLPRLVEVKSGHIYFKVHPETEKYFTEEFKNEGAVEAEIDLTFPCRMRTELNEGETLDIGGFQIKAEDGCIQTDRSQVFTADAEAQLKSSTPELDGKYELDIFVEEHLIEIFINDGQYVVSNIVYGLGTKVRGRIEHIFLHK